MTSKEAYENIGLALKCYLPKGISKEIKEELQESWDTIRKDLEVLEILSKSINIKLQELDGYYFLQINNEPIRSITKEEYEILKEWKDGR